MTTEHTPGPWLYRPKEYDDWGIVRASERCEFGFQRVICKANYVASPEELTQHRVDGTDPAEANARLIAAAPELLEALENLTDNITAAFPSMENLGPIITARAAIAKAKGAS